MDWREVYSSTMDFNVGIIYGALNLNKITTKIYDYNNIEISREVFRI